MNILTFIIVFLVGFWVGQHLGLQRVGGKIFPLGIWYEKWVFVHRLQLQVWNYKVSFWLKDYGKEKNKWARFWTILPHYRWGVGSIYGTPHGDLHFPYCEYRRWGKKFTKIKRRKWMK